MTQYKSISLSPAGDAVKQKNDSKASTPLDNDARLFSRFLAGDDSAFMELFDRHTHKLFMYCLKFVGDRGEAEDLVQDLWERVIRMRKEGREELGNPVGFMIRMARNLSLNRIRDRKGASSLDDVSESQLPSSSAGELSHHEELVVTALPHLPDAQREVLILNAYSGYRFDEIAEMLGEPVGAIRTRAWRARVQLGRIISAMIGLDENKQENNESDSSNLENDR